MERNNNSSYIQKNVTNRCENYREIALGNAAYKILTNIILEKIKPYTKKITRNYQDGFNDGRSVGWIQRWKICNWQHICIENNKQENLGI